MTGLTDTSDTHEDDKPARMAALLDSMRPREGEKKVTVDQILTRIGEDSFPATLLVLGLLMVSPLSSVPLLPALVALIILAVALQSVLGRRTLWLPKLLTRRAIKADRLQKALVWLHRPANWIDRNTSGRWGFLTRRPLSAIAELVIVVVALSWPPTSWIPMSATITAVGITLLAAGLTLRDGVYVVAGYAYLGLIVAGGAAVVWGLI